jgi:hypothetical protein
VSPYVESNPISADGQWASCGAVASEYDFAMKKFFAAIVICVLLVGAVWTGRARGADAKPGEAAIIGEVSLSSIDRVHSAMVRGGFDGYRELFLGLVESFPTIGKGMIDTTSPIAIQFIGGDNVPSEGQAMFAFPVKPGTADLKEMLDKGFKADPDHPDTAVAGNGFGVRRTKNYQLAGGTRDMLAKLDEDALAAPYKDTTLLARATVDLKTLRIVAPVRFKAFLDEIEKQQELQGAAQLQGVRMVTSPIRDKLDQVEFSILAKEQTIAVRAVASPVALQSGPLKFPRPTFPEGCFVRVDYAYPSQDAIASFKSLMDAILKIEFGDNAKKFQAVGDAFNSLFIGDAISVAVERVDDQMVGYGVIQNAKEKNVDAEAGMLEQAISAADGNNRKPLVKSTYEDNGEKVTRLTMMDHEKAVGYVDLVGRGNLIYATYSQKETKLLSRLSGPKPDGEFSSLLHAEADLAKWQKVFGAMGLIEKDFPAELLKEGKLALDVTGDGKSLTVEMSAPISSLAVVMKMAPLK